MPHEKWVAWIHAAKFCIVDSEATLYYDVST